MRIYYENNIFLDTMLLIEGKKSKILTFSRDAHNCSFKAYVQ